MGNVGYDIEDIGYINIIQVDDFYNTDYFLFLSKQNGIRCPGIGHNGEKLIELEKYLSSFIERVPEKKIILKSIIPPERRCSKISKNELEELRNFLSNKRKDITFLIERQPNRRGGRRINNFQST